MIGIRTRACGAVLLGLLWAVGPLAAATQPSGRIAHPGSRIIFPIFWTWQDRQIEDPELMRRELLDIKQAGFGGVYCTLRATRYHLLDREVTEAARRASALCREQGLEFVWGADPRFAATPIIRATGHGAETLLVNRTFQVPLDGADAEGPNEVRAEDGRYSLRYPIPARRDLHVSTEVSLQLDPVGVDRVFAYRKQGGRVLRASVRDVTACHHFFASRASGYVEVFGRLDLPPGDWYVFAFPRFRTNVYAYDSPEHQRHLLELLEHYKEEGLQLDGLWWDAPGYYFQFGHFAISQRIYDGFRAKCAYELGPQLLGLMLELDDASHLRVRYDYFQLQADAISPALLASGEVVNDALEIQGQRYKAVVVPYGSVTTPEALRVLEDLRRRRVPLHFLAETLAWTIGGERVSQDFGQPVSLPADSAGFAAAVEVASMPAAVRGAALRGGGWRGTPGVSSRRADGTPR